MLSPFFPGRAKEAESGIANGPHSPPTSRRGGGAVRPISRAASIQQVIASRTFSKASCGVSPWKLRQRGQIAATLFVGQRANADFPRATFHDQATARFGSGIGSPCLRAQWSQRSE